MTYFKTPEQYLAEYPGLNASLPVTANVCPTPNLLRGEECKQSECKFVKGNWGGLVKSMWRCKHFHHFDEYKVIVVGSRIESRTFAQFVVDRLSEDRERAYTRISALAPTSGSGGVMGGVAQIGMYSDDPTFARQSMAYSAQLALRQFNNQHQSERYFDRENALVDAEFEYAYALADEYFYGDERRAQDAAEEADRIVAQAEALADAMMRRVQQQGSRTNSTS